MIVFMYKWLKNGVFRRKLEYSFKSTFGMDDMSPSSFADLNSRLAGAEGDADWQ
jgi:hypothetical protein